MTLFDAFGEGARRSLFFARWAVSRFGGSEIDEAHLLLGVLQASPESVTRFTDPTAWTTDRLKRRLHELVPHEPRLPDSTEIPFSDGAREAIVAAAARAALTQAEVVPAHIVWALLQVPATPAAQLLSEAGVTQQAIETSFGAPPDQAI